jgi:predicted acyltransferase
MNTIVDTHAERMHSIDVFRGLTILVMIFVNDLAGVTNVPWWMKHMPQDGNGMTFVDVVFPAFLFIVGMAIPFALEKRIKKGDSLPALIKHIVTRTAGLVILGVYMVNIHGLNETATGMSRHVWMLLLFIGAILVWNSYRREGIFAKTPVVVGLKLVGTLLLAYLALIYRSGDGTAWMHTSWWGILGLIGWAYLTTSLVYIAFRKRFDAVLGMLVLFVLLYIADKTGALNFLGALKEYLWLGGFIGGHSSITTAGMIVSMVFMGTTGLTTYKAKMQWIVGFTIFLFVAGYFLSPLYGIDKIGATPSWCLYSSAICCLIFLFLYWLIDIKSIKGWTIVAAPAGANPLLAYILPDIFYALIGIFGVTIWSAWFGDGVVGILRSTVLAFAMVGLTALLTRVGVKLHL